MPIPEQGWKLVWTRSNWPSKPHHHSSVTHHVYNSQNNHEFVPSAMHTGQSCISIFTDSVTCMVQVLYWHETVWMDGALAHVLVDGALAHVLVGWAWGTQYGWIQYKAQYGWVELEHVAHSIGVWGMRHTVCVDEGWATVRVGGGAG